MTTKGRVPKVTKVVQLPAEFLEKVLSMVEQVKSSQASVEIQLQHLQKRMEALAYSSIPPSRHYAHEPIRYSATGASIPRHLGVPSVGHARLTDPEISHKVYEYEKLKDGTLKYKDPYLWQDAL